MTDHTYIKQEPSSPCSSCTSSTFSYYHSCITPDVKVLTSSNKIIIVQLNISKYRMYRHRPCRIENLCGQFIGQVNRREIHPVLITVKSCLGRQEDVYSIHGNGCFMKSQPHKMHFKGCRNMQAVTKFARHMGLDSPSTIVHMAVVSGCMGTLVDIRPGGLMEDILHKMGVETYRIPDTTNTLCFHLDLNLMDKDFPSPRQTDWSITTRGSVIVRITWDFLEWSKDIEDRLTVICNKFMDVMADEVRKVPVTV